MPTAWPRKKSSLCRCRATVQPQRPRLIVPLEAHPQRLRPRRSQNNEGRGQVGEVEGRKMCSRTLQRETGEGEDRGWEVDCEIVSIPNSGHHDMLQN